MDLNPLHKTLKPKWSSLQIMCRVVCMVVYLLRMSRVFTVTLNKHVHAGVDLTPYTACKYLATSGKTDEIACSIRG